ncbi:MAG TPA: hypothetical protein VKU00_23320 [Chthonomonadaceae bacterium]|nr:hypothetical protein [Chthonomonadaceae bacterium]
MEKSPSNIEQRLLDAEARFATAERQHRQAARRFRLLSGVALCGVVLAVLFAAHPSAGAQDCDYQDQIDALQSEVNDLQSQTQYLSTGTDAEGYPAMYVSGCNLWVLNGTGATNAAPNGEGNLIIGYNELRGNNDDRSGSHNLIVGSFQNYQSVGGAVFGDYNTLSGQYASVLGGASNTAAGDFTSVAGGYNNSASGRLSSVTGGASNNASGAYAAISGGTSNFAGGQYASISGGYNNSASGYVASLTGGNQNSANGNYASVTGGFDNSVGGAAAFAALLGGQGISLNTPYGHNP